MKKEISVQCRDSLAQCKLKKNYHASLENLHLFFVSLCSKMPAWRRRTAEFAVAFTPRPDLQNFA